MSSRWECNMCSWNCILLTEGCDQPTCCPYHANTLPIWERVEDEEENEEEK